MLSALDRAVVIKLPTRALRQDGKLTAVWVLDLPSPTVRVRQVPMPPGEGNEVAARVPELEACQKVTSYKDKQALAPVNTKHEATD